MALYFTSDTHFGDHRVLNLYPRPFATVAAMDEELIGLWNAAVGPEDEVWHLGDFARSEAGAAAIFSRLNGVKHLVRGNNDPSAVDRLGWRSVQDYAEIQADGRKLVLCHYPFRSWNGMAKGALNLHGHSHGRISPLPRQADVGVDVRGYRPRRLSELFRTRASRTKSAS